MRRELVSAFVLAALAACLFVTRPLVAEPGASQPYLYQRAGQGIPGEIAVEIETAYGSRDARPFGAEGFEQGARVRTSPLRWLTAEAWGGALITAGAYKAAAGAIDLHVAVLNQDDHAVNLSLGAGYLFDYQQVHVPRFRVTLGRSWGPIDTSLAGYLEVPTAEGRDTVDLVLALAASYRVAPWARVGLEAEGQDLEGFWEPEEAEGGAKLILGPTAWFRVWDRLYTKLNVGAVVPATTNAPTRIAPGVDPAAFDYGVLARAVMGWSFR